MTDESKLVYEEKFEVFKVNGTSKSSSGDYLVSGYFDATKFVGGDGGEWRGRFSTFNNYVSVLGNGEIVNLNGMPNGLYADCYGMSASEETMKRSALFFVSSMTLF